MDTERMLRTTPLQTTEEDDLVVDFLHAHIVVLDTREILLHLIEFMIMGGKKGAGTGLDMLVQVFHNSPGNGNAVVGGGATAQLIEEHQRAGRYIVEDIGGLGHLDHKGGLTQRDIVGGSHTGEYFVHQTDSCGFCGHETSYLGHEYDKGGLAQQRRFTSHIRTRDDNNLLSLVVEHDIIGHIALA